MSTRQPRPHPTPRPAPRTHRPPPPRPDPRVFRRRRIVAALIFIILLAGMVWGAMALKTWLLPTQVAPVEPADAQPSGPTEEELANPTDCLPGAVQVEVSLAADSFPVGQAVSVPVMVRNTGELPCLLETGRQAIEVSITSGGDAVWSSDHCGGGLPEERRLLLDATEQDTTVVTWPGTRSAKGCPGEQDQAKGGTYRLHATVSLPGGSVETEQVFGLH